MAPVLRLAREHGAFAPAVTPLERESGDGWRSIRANLPNDRVGAFVSAVAARVEEPEFVLLPHGTLPISLPLADLRERVADVSRRSTLELVLDGLQSIGSWSGMLTYALVSGVVAAYGVLFDTPYLLTAGMLIAPMGAPAMVTALGITIGDGWMVRRGTVRFFASLVVLALAAALLGYAYGLRVSTPTMEAISNLSAWAVLLSVAGGWAGAQAMARSDRDSLVTATATGFLVAVALSPPSAVLGLAVPMGRWDYVVRMAFLLLLTFFGVQVGAWLSLHLLGVGASDAPEGRGTSRLRWALVAAAVLVTAGMVAWQTRQEPSYLQADLSREAVRVSREAVSGLEGLAVVDAEARFTRQDASWHPGEGLLVQLIVVRRATAGGAEGGLPSQPPEDEVESRVRATVERLLRTRIEGIHPFVSVTVLP